MSVLSTIVKSAGAVFIGLAISKIFTYIYRAVIAKYLGLEPYGLITIGLTILGLAVMLSTLGLNSGLLKFVPFYKGKRDWIGIQRTLGAAIMISLALGALCAILLIIFSQLLAQQVFHNAALRPIIVLFSLLVPVMAAGGLLNYALRAYGLIGQAVFTTNIFITGLQVLLTALFLYFGRGVLWAAAAYSVAVLAGAALSGVFVWQNILRRLPAQQQPTEQNTGKLIGYSVPMMLSASIGSDSSISTLFVGFFLGTAGAGLYGAAFPTAALVLAIPEMLLALFIPTISELYASKNESQIAETYQIVLRWVMMLVLPLVIFAALFPKQILHAIFGGAFGPAATVLALLAAAQLFRAVMQVPRGLLAAQGHAKAILHASIAGAAVNIGGALLLIPLLGINGAGISFLLAAIAAAACLFTSASRIIHAGFTKSNYLPILLAVVISTTIFYISGVTGRGLAHIAAAGLIYLAIYAGLLYLLGGLTPRDFGVIRAGTSFLRRRILRQEAGETIAGSN